jgi:hypothetical protein
MQGLQTLQLATFPRLQALQLPTFLKRNCYLLMLCRLSAGAVPTASNPSKSLTENISKNHAGSIELFPQPSIMAESRAVLANCMVRVRIVSAGSVKPSQRCFINRPSMRGAIVPPLCHTISVVTLFHTAKNPITPCLARPVRYGRLTVPVTCSGPLSQMRK